MWWDCSSWLKEACSLSGGSKSNWAKRWSQYLSACHQSKAVATYSYMCLEVSIVTGAKPEERHTQHRACTSGDTQPAGHAAISRKQHFSSRAAPSPAGLPTSTQRPPAQPLPSHFHAEQEAGVSLLQHPKAFTNPVHPRGEESGCLFLCSAPGMFRRHSVTETSRLSWNENAGHPWVCSQTESLA